MTISPVLSVQLPLYGSVPPLGTAMVSNTLALQAIPYPAPPDRIYNSS